MSRAPWLDPPAESGGGSGFHVTASCSIRDLCFAYQAKDVQVYDCCCLLLLSLFMAGGYSVLTSTVPQEPSYELFKQAQLIFSHDSFFTVFCSYR